MDPNSNRRRSVDAGIAAQSTQLPTLNRSRSFKTKQLVRSQAIRESQSPPRLPSPRPETAPERNEEAPGEAPAMEGPIGEVATCPSSQERCDRPADDPSPTRPEAEAPPKQYSSQERTEDLKPPEHQVVIQVTSGDQYDSSPTRSRNPCQYSDSKTVLADTNKARQRSRRWHSGKPQNASSEEYNDNLSQSDSNRMCICGSCECANTAKRRGQPPCPSKQDSGVVCCSDDCPDCLYWRSVDIPNNELESPTSEKPEKQRQWSNCLTEFQNLSTDVNAMTCRFEQKLQICRCQEKCDRIPAVKNKNNISLTIQRTDSDELHCEPTGADLARFIKDTLNKNLKDRVTLLKIEKELITFINDPSRFRCHFPTMTSYGRMLVHRCASLFGLNHMVDSATKTSVVVTKTGLTNYRIPCTPFRQWCSVVFPTGSPSQMQQDNALQAKSILKRDSHSLDEPLGPGLSRGLTSDGNGPPARSKSFEQREEEYERVRRRIFSVEERKCMDAEGEGGEWAWAGGAARVLAPRGVGAPRGRGGHAPCDPLDTRPRLLSRQGDLALSSWRLSPSSSGYKTLSFRSTDSVTPSPTGGHTPEPSQDATSSSAPTISEAPSGSSLVWAVSDMSAIPTGALIIHPQTGRPITNSDGSLYRYDPARPPRMGDVVAPQNCPSSELTEHHQQDSSSPEKRRGRLEKQKSIVGCSDYSDYHADCTENTQKSCQASSETGCTSCQCNATKTIQEPNGSRYDASTSPLDNSQTPQGSNERCDQSPLRRNHKDPYTQIKADKPRICETEYCEDCDGGKERLCDCYRDCRPDACQYADYPPRQRQAHAEERRENETNVPVLSLSQPPRPANPAYAIPNDLDEVLKQQMALASADQFQCGQPTAAVSYCPPYSPPTAVPYQFCDEQSLTFTYAHHRSHPLQYPVEAVTPTAPPLVRGITQPIAPGAFLVNQALNPYHQKRGKRFKIKCFSGSNDGGGVESGWIAQLGDWDMPDPSVSSAVSALTDNNAGLWPNAWALSSSSGATNAAVPPPTPLYAPLPPPQPPPHNKGHPLHGLYLHQSEYGLLPSPYHAAAPTTQLYQAHPNLVQLPSAYAAHNYNALLAAGHTYGLFPGYTYPQNVLSVPQTPDDRSPGPVTTFDQTSAVNVPLICTRRDFDNSANDDNRSKTNTSSSGSIPNTPQAYQSPSSSYPNSNQHTYPTAEGYNPKAQQNYFQFPTPPRIPEYANGEYRQEGNEGHSQGHTDKQMKNLSEGGLVHTNVDHAQQFYHSDQQKSSTNDKPQENSTETQYPADDSSARNFTSNLNAESKNFVPKSRTADSPQTEAAKDIMKNIKKLQERQSARFANTSPFDGQHHAQRFRGGNRNFFDRRNFTDQRGNSVPISTNNSGANLSGNNQFVQPNLSNSVSPAMADSGRRYDQGPRFTRSRDGERPDYRPRSDYIPRNTTPPARQGLIPLNPRVFGEHAVTYPSPSYGSAFRARAPSLVAQQMQAIGLYPRPAFLFRQMSANSGMWNRRSSGDVASPGPSMPMYRPPRNQRPHLDGGFSGPRGNNQYGRSGFNQRR